MLNSNITKIAIVALIAAVVCVYATSYFIEVQQKDIVSGITLQIVEQEKTLSNIAEITDSNGADAVVEAIILDCSVRDRNRFDDLLDTLGTLDTTELLEIENLFDKCAYYHSERKAVMVSRLEREYEIYSTLVDLLAIVDDPTTITMYSVEEWAQLVQLEKKRSTIFDQQVAVQYDIIKALQNGERVGSEAVNVMLENAKNINESAVVVNQQIDTLHNTLFD